MNLNKAREYFSAYYEGTLDKGLAQSFERSLREDAQLQAEYRAFESTMEELSSMSAPVEVPDDLHERISARLDRHIWENKQTQRTGITSWWRILAIGGAAVAVIALALIQANGAGGKTPSNTTPATTIPAPINSERKLEIKPQINGVTLSYSSTDAKAVTISDSEGKELNKYTVGGNVELKDQFLGNTGDRANIFVVKVGDEAPVYIALPGSKPAEFTAGNGTLLQFIESVADGYRMPVVLNADTVEQNVVWERGDDLISTANKLADSQHLKAEVRQAQGSDQSLLWLQKH